VTATATTHVTPAAATTAVSTTTAMLRECGRTDREKSRQGHCPQHGSIT
jgi:hypothetical protein